MWDLVSYANQLPSATTVYFISADAIFNTMAAVRVNGWGGGVRQLCYILSVGCGLHSNRSPHPQYIVLFRACACGTVCSDCSFTIFCARMRTPWLPRMFR